jgi:hypothetical protein
MSGAGSRPLSWRPLSKKRKGFATANAPLVDRLPVGMRRHFLQLIEREQAA